MIEMRIIDNGPMYRPEFQYRYKLPLVEWTEWKTAEWIKAEEIENDTN